MKYLITFLLLCSTINAQEYVVKTLGTKLHGTGFIYNRTDTHYFILTSAHLGTIDDPKVMFYHEGHEIGPIEAKIHEYDHNVDLMILKVDKHDLPYFRYLKIAPDGGLKMGEYFFTVGCPNGNWPTLYEGHTDENDKMVPVPFVGRSGSPIVNADGFAIGLVKLQDGTYVHLSDIRKFLYK